LLPFFIFVCEFEFCLSMEENEIGQENKCQ